MKCDEVGKWMPPGVVAPLAGAWIEMIVSHPNRIYMMVAPLAGAWIEMQEY